MGDAGVFPPMHWGRQRCLAFCIISRHFFHLFGTATPLPLFFQQVVANTDNFSAQQGKDRNWNYTFAKALKFYGLFGSFGKRKLGNYLWRFFPVPPVFFTAVTLLCQTLSPMRLCSPLPEGGAPLILNTHTQTDRHVPFRQWLCLDSSFIS